MDNKYKWKKIDKMPSNDKPLLILDSKNKLHILYKEWEERDSFGKWFKLCAEEDIKKWCYFEIDGMNYFDEVLKQNAHLQEQLDREIHINRKMKRALKQIASENDCYLTIADKVLKEIDNKE